MFQLGLLLIDSFHRETFVRFFLVLWGPCMINHCQILFDDSFLSWQKFFFDHPPAPLYSSSDILGFSSHESCRTCWKIIFGWVWVVRASFLTLSGLVKGAKVRVARSRDILRTSYRRSTCWPPTIIVSYRHLTAAYEGGGRKVAGDPKFKLNPTLRPEEKSRWGDQQAARQSQPPPRLTSARKERT